MDDGTTIEGSKNIPNFMLIRIEDESMMIKLNWCFWEGMKREMKLNSVVKIGTWSERENLKSCLENKRSLGKHGWLRGGGEIIGTRESFSNKLHSKRSVDLSKVSRISLEVSVESNEKKAAITRLSETRINRWWPMRFYQERLVVHSSTQNSREAVLSRAVHRFRFYCYR